MVEQGRSSKPRGTRGFRGHVVRSFIALGGSVIVFAGLAVFRAFSGGRTVGQGLERIVTGLAIAALTVAAIVIILVACRLLFQRGLAAVLRSRAGAIAVDTVRNRELVRAAMSQDHDRVPFFLALIADQRGVEVVGGMFRLVRVWSAVWADVTEVRVGATFDGRQSYECLELETRAPAVATLPLVVTGRGITGFGAIEGEALQDLAAEMNELRNSK